MTTGTRVLSLDEFLALPETEPYTELIDGEPCRKPVGKKKHSRAQLNMIALLLASPATTSGSVSPELGVRFPGAALGNLRIPDVSYYLPGHEDTSDEDYPDRAPDLAVELRSKGQSLASVQRRLAFLVDQGTRCTLLIDPGAQTVAVRDGEREWLATGEEEVVLSALNGFRFGAADLFR